MCWTGIWVVVLFLMGMGLINFRIRKVPFSQSWLYIATAFSMVAVLGINYKPEFRLTFLALSIVCLLISLSLKIREKNMNWAYEGGALQNMELAMNLRTEAGKLRIVGQFDMAYSKYKKAYAIYEKLGDKDAQCNVLCSLAETTPYDEIPEILNKIEAICTSLEDTEEKTKAFRNLEALKERLRIHHRI